MVPMEMLILGIIPLADAVVDPIAVMIKTIDASLADKAVPHIFIYLYFTLRTELIWGIFFYQLQKRNILGLIEITRISVRCEYKQHICNKKT